MCTGKVCGPLIGLEAWGQRASRGLGLALRCVEPVTMSLLSCRQADAPADPCGCPVCARPLFWEGLLPLRREGSGYSYSSCALTPLCPCCAPTTVPHLQERGGRHRDAGAVCGRSQVLHRVAAAAERRADCPGELSQPEYPGHHPAPGKLGGVGSLPGMAIQGSPGTGSCLRLRALGASKRLSKSAGVLTSWLLPFGVAVTCCLRLSRALASSCKGHHGLWGLNESSPSQNGNITELLLKEGFARCVDWSIAVYTRGADKLRAAERYLGHRGLRGAGPEAPGPGLGAGLANGIPGWRAWRLELVWPAS